jgi:hypothetical protein
LAREEDASQGYESSSEESVEEENNLVGRDMEEEPFPEQEGASVEGQSQDVRFPIYPMEIVWLFLLSVQYRR